MGTYTGLKLDVELNNKTKEQWSPLLEYMLDNTKPKPVAIKHDLLNTSRWTKMLFAISSSLDCEYNEGSKLEINNLKVNFNIKNNDYEIEKFLNWLSPHVVKVNSGKFQMDEIDESADVYLDHNVIKIKDIYHQY